MTGARGRKLADAIVSRLRAGPETSDEVYIAFAELDELPEDVVRAALEPWLGPGPDIEHLDDATRAAHGFPPRKLRLRTLAIVKDADVLFLGPVAEEQLRVAGRSWDGVDTEPEERLDEDAEHSFAGTLEHHTLVAAFDATDTPLFEVVRFLGDAGVIFRAGTAKPIGYIADGRVEVSDARICAAIDEALRAEPAPAPVPVPVPKEKKPKKKTATPKAKSKSPVKTKAKPKAKTKPKPT
jgi:hypothetical protein